ncbi:hypothetical protein [Candidatus Uabimicrobium amorphum]|uniref:Uncharacterized protein n=1 Tax=Uabimicrobium amorphum TaxID=2596890 RepID=A0A5S9F3P0_UABAM|nr:hypothetical protein [Candidatus Uabimicrobium amorphum]BBM84698.1 hypothetical protein UABAM_03059 [Candidatus Uabimicrobium amorphum]
MWKFLLIICLVLSSCETLNSSTSSTSSTSSASQDSKVGEPCEYYQQPFSMAVTEIRPFGQSYHVMLDHKGHQYILSELIDRPTDSAFIRENDIAVGQVLTGIEKTITQGTCTPVLFEFETKFLFSQ